MTQLDNLRAALADRYTIGEDVGSGGMATVYRARDVKHDRDVAVKVLRGDVAESIGGERFLREIRIAAKLQHPHILPLLDSGDLDGTLYYVMPMVEGESLRERIDREGELPVNEAIRLVREVTDALAFAHAQGIVHRDIKPDNVMVSGRHALVTDFGVAKAVSEATGDDKVTTVGVALGTPAYMSPEQAAADPHVDHRADLYAVGVLAYELLTGSPPFSGATPQQVLAAQVTQTPRPITEMRPAVPEVLASVVMRCLEKKAADRWQTAEELLGQFESSETVSGGMTPTGLQPWAAAVAPVPGVGRHWMAGAAVVAVTAAAFFLGPWGPSGSAVPGGPTVGDADVAIRLLVLPFQNQTGDAEHDPLGRLAASWVERGLTRAGLVDVVPLRSVLDEATSSVGQSELLSSAGADYGVSGEYYLRGGDVEVRARIMDVATNRVLVELEPVRAPISDPMAAFDGVSRRASGSVAALINADEEGVISWGGAPPSLEAFRAFEQGRSSFSQSDYASALGHFQRAERMDTAWLTPAYFMMATFYNLGRHAEADSVERYLEERRGRLTGLELAGLDGMIGWTRGDLEREYQASLRLVKLDRVGMAYDAAVTASRLNRLDEALVHISLRDTTTSMGANWSGWYVVEISVLLRLGRTEEALERARSATRRFPDRAPGHLRSQAQALAVLDRLDELEPVLADARARANPLVSVDVLNDAAWVLSGLGRDAEAVRMADRALAENKETSQDGRARRAWSHYYAGRWAEAESAWRALLLETPNNTLWLSRWGVTLAHMGRMDEAEAARARIEATEYPFTPFFRQGENRAREAYILAAMGESDRALTLLREAVQSGLSFGTWTLWAPELRELRDDPRYQRLVAPKR